jgi:hypothetical protein
VSYFAHPGPWVFTFMLYTHRCRRHALHIGRLVPPPRACSAPGSRRHRLFLFLVPSIVFLPGVWEPLRSWMRLSFLEVSHVALAPLRGVQPPSANVPQVSLFFFLSPWFKLVPRNAVRCCRLRASAERHLGSSLACCCRARATDHPQLNALDLAIVHRRCVFPCLHFGRICVAARGFNFWHEHDLSLQPPIVSRACLQVS